MATRVGMMGFGRIGRNIFRILHGRDDLVVGAIVDVAHPAGLEYLLRFDTVLGRFPHPVKVADGALFSDGRRIPLLSHERPEQVPWDELEIDYVVDATGRYRTRAELEGHLRRGARRVVLTVPPKEFDEVDALVVRGVNDEEIGPEDRIISHGSCTINAVAPVLKVLHQNYGVRQAFMNSVHAYTNQMRLADVPHRDLRRSRAAAENVIPTDTYSPAAIGRVLPELEGRLTGLALNVPVPDGSCVDLTIFSERPLTREGINECMRSAAQTRLRQVLEFSEDPLVSSDVVGNSHTAVFDSLATLVMGDDLAKLVVWYDNGWGYTQRVVETLYRLREIDGAEVGA